MAKYVITDDSELTVDSGIIKIVLGSETSTLNYGTTAGNITLVLKRIDYDKRVYRPGYLKLTFSQTTSIDWATVNSILDDLVKNAESITFKLKNGDDYNVINQDYYCYNAKINNTISYTENDKGQKEAKANYRVVLECYSQDHKLTLFPSCSAWTGKKFREEIVPAILAKYGLVDATVHDSTTNLTFLKPSDNEIPIPYLVQYNESPYDFICRVANRCGEYLYNEGGKLCIGLRSTEASENTISTAFVQFNDHVNTYNPEVELYSNTGGQNSDTDLPYNGCYTDDKYGELITQDEDEYNFEFWMGMAIFGAFLGGSSVDECIQETITAIGDNYGIYSWARQIAHDESSDWFTGYASKLGGLVEDSSKIINDTFSRIDDREKTALEGTVKLDFQNSETHGLYLGDGVKVAQLGNTQYTVTAIYGYLSKETNDSPVDHYVEVTPVFGSADGDISTHVPPLDSRERTRKSAPQEAKIVDTNDPLMMGRVRVKFLWQKSEKTTDKNGKTVENSVTASPWIRMTTPFAGGKDGGGFFMMPEVGSHVMVNFMNDNIELPYVDGALYYENGSDDTSAPDWGYVDSHKKFFKPDFKRRVLTSGTGTGISFVDGSGSCNFLAGMIPLVPSVLGMFSATKDWIGKALPTLEGNMALRDSNGVNEINLNTTGRAITINSPIGKVEINAFTGITISAPNGDISLKGKNINIVAGNNLTLKSGNNIKDDTFVDDYVLGGGLLGAVGSFMGGAAAEVAKFASKNFLGFDPSKLCDIKFIRSVVEVILRPVEGSLKVMSKRNVIMTAGNGKVVIPSSNLADSLKKKKVVNNSYMKAHALYTSMPDMQNLYNAKVMLLNTAIAELLNEMNTINARDRKYKRQDSQLRDNDIVKAFNAIFTSQSLEDVLKKTQKFASKVKIKNNAMMLTRADVLKGGIFGWHETRTEFLPDANAYLGKVFNFIKALECNVIPTSVPSDFTKSKISKSLNTYFDTIIKNAPDNANYLKKSVDFSKIDDIDKVPLVDVSFQIRVQMLKDYSKDFGIEFDDSGTDWTAIVNSIKKKEDGTLVSNLKSFGKEFGSALATTVGLDIDSETGANSWGKLVNWNGQAGPRSAWEVGSNSGIYLSNEKNVTLKVNKDGKSWIPVANPNIEQIKFLLSHDLRPAALTKIRNLDAYLNTGTNTVREEDIKLTNR